MTTTVTDTMEARAKDVEIRRERVHRLVDEMHEGELETVETLVEFVHERGDPVRRKLLNAPYDDEPVTPDEEEAVREAWEAVKAGDVHTMEEVKRELGL